jgi:restriction endonuclease Mrr
MLPMLDAAGRQRRIPAGVRTRTTYELKKVDEDYFTE